MSPRAVSAWLAVLWLAAAPASGASLVNRSVNHAPFNALLKRHVRDGRVDYRGLAQDREALETYLASVAAAHPDYWDRTDQLAFWLNAYNACALRSVLEQPSAHSVQEIKGFFDQRRCSVGSRDLTLQQIEAEAGKVGDWRVRVAAARPAVGGPWLRGEAYAADRLEAQLDEQARQFLADPVSGVRVKDNALWASAIFKERPKELVQGRVTAETLLGLLRPWLPPVFDRVNSTALQLKWIPFDWTLNASSQPQ